MTDNIKIFRDFDQVIRNQYSIVPLRDLGDISIGQENAVSFFIKIVRSKLNIKPFDYSDLKFYEELLFITKDIKYYTALLYFFRPYITDSSYDGKYIQTFEDRRYMMFASVSFQSVYIFWDRIGDLLDKFFKTGLSDTSIYFPRVLNNFPKEFKNSENYKWLDSTYHGEIKNFIGQRDDIVHSYQLESEYYWRVIESTNNIEKIHEIQKEKEEFPEKLKHQIDLLLLGFEKALNLIGEFAEQKSR